MDSTIFRDPNRKALNILLELSKIFNENYHNQPKGIATFVQSLERT